MLGPQKQCPKCDKTIPAARSKCEHCGHAFPPRKSPQKPSAALREIESDEPEFAAAITLDGRLMLVWPRQAESVTLSADEAGLVLRALLAPGKRVVIDGRNVERDAAC